MADDPWAEFRLKPAPKADPWADFRVKPTEEPRSAVGDFFKSIPRGILKGAAGMASAMGQAEAQQMGMEGIPSGERGVELTEQHVTGALPQPQGAAGRFGAAVGETLGNPVSYIGPGGALRSAATSVAGALGAEAGGQAAGLPGAVVGGALAGGLTGKLVGRGVPPIPGKDVSELKQAADQAYDDLRAMNLTLPAKDAVQLEQDIKNTFNSPQYSFDRPDQPRTFRAVDRITENALGTPAKPSAGITSDRLYAIRTALNHVIRDSKSGSATAASDAMAAGVAIEKIDNFLSQIPGFADKAQIARENYRALKMSQNITGAAEKARLAAGSSGMGTNFPNALRQKMKSLLLDRRIHKTPEEREMLRKMVVNSRLLPEDFRLGNKHSLAGWIPAVVVDASHHGGLGTTLKFANALAQYIEKRSLMKQVREFDEYVRGGQPRQRVPFSGTVGAARGAATGTDLYGND